MAGKNVTIGSVNIAMSANAAQLIKEANSAQSQFKKAMRGMRREARKLNKEVGKQFKDVSKAATGLATDITKAGLVGGVGGGVFGALAYQIYESQREMQRMADVAGISMTTFSQMSHATNSLGLETEYLSDAMKDLNVRIIDAARGGGTMTDFFALMGEDAREWLELNPTEQLDKFQKKLSELSDNEAKFWADEVNDSMYRLSVTLSRSGRTVGDFMAEAQSLGAGTSAGYMYMVNGMYESFSRLRIILGELTNTTFALLAQSFGKTMDEMTRNLQGLIGESDSMSEGIFNLSKQIALSILETFKLVYESAEALITRLQKLTDTYEPTQVEKESAALAQVEQRLTAIQFAREQVEKHGEGVLRGLNTEANLIEEQNALYERRAKLLQSIGSAGNTTGMLDSLIEGVRNTQYTPPKPSSPQNGTVNTTDPAELKKVNDLLANINIQYGEETDSKLRGIEVDRQRLTVAQKTLQTLKEQGTLSDAGVTRLSEVNDAMAKLDQEASRRRKELAKERKEEREDEAQAELDLARSTMAKRLEFLRANSFDERAIRAAERVVEANELSALYEQGVITHQEMQDAMELQTQLRNEAEMRLEMQKIGSTLNGLAFFMNESQGMARAGFAFTQAAALQEVLLNQYRAVSAAWADPTLPWYMKAGAAVTAAGAVGNQLAQIQAMGQFHNGGQIPYDGTYYMEGGEIVIPKDRVGDYIDAIDRHATVQGGGAPVINSTINMGANLVDEKVMAQALSKQQSTIAALVQKEQRKRPTRSRS
ncbi:phage tail tape measure protein [Vibrio fortis]|uniref:Phage tail tape measure protein n=1 Tax=Vibrio fortis TaxID=212667 RepID=A0A5N3QUY8_9VIBR|nr:phage tail tape measure protein [Vibrio fortis]KAB0285471.1 phage tail tape measure protein [Vibrio fortis]